MGWPHMRESSVPEGLLQPIPLPRSHEAANWRSPGSPSQYRHGAGRQLSIAAGSFRPATKSRRGQQVDDHWRLVKSFELCTHPLRDRAGRNRKRGVDDNTGKPLGEGIAQSSVGMHTCTKATGDQTLLYILKLCKSQLECTFLDRPICAQGLNIFRKIAKVRDRLGAVPSPVICLLGHESAVEAVLVAP